ncbi:hypothetical protein TSAR_013370 [Trichomalopsis sarcophagae]|uniref:Uncharacterized protein n=1 Tax=Trichomalopsis sarcophagae TaxID=543379 RepID=A0A232F2Z5_9HYME|nr:hypothetical protein TSAR_013370 [Trichomalopsis sarcophagae]
MFAFATALLVISVFSVNAGEIQLHLQGKEAAEKCSKDIGITLETVDATVKNELKDADEKFKCFAACVFKEKEMLKDDGSINVAKVIEDLPDEIKGDVRDAMIKTIEKCSQKKEANECETVFQAVQCAMQDMSKLKLF